jgi:predicted transcriptional regulator
MLAQEIETSKGQSEKSIRNRISDAQKAYQKYISEHGKN